MARRQVVARFLRGAHAIVHETAARARGAATVPSGLAQSATRMAFSQPSRAVPVKTAGHVPTPDLQYTRSVAELLTWANPEGRAEDISKRRSRGEGVRL